MKTEWNTVPLAKIVKCEGGTAFPHRYQGRRQGDYPFFKVSDMNALANSWKMVQAANYVSKADLAELRTKPKPANSVVFPKVGGAVLTNKKRMLASPAAIDNNLMAVWPLSDTECLADFLYFYFLSTDLAELANPGPLPSINASRIYEREIRIPGTAEQEKIAAVLWKIQKAVEIEDAIARNARDLKKSLLRRLFTRGLRGELLKETEIGPVPQSWEVEPLSRVREFLQYGTSQRCELSRKGFPVLRIPNVVAGKIDTSEIKYADMPAKAAENLRLSDGDLLFVRTNGQRDFVGRCAVYKGKPAGALFASYLIRARLFTDRVNPDFVQAYTMTDTGKSFLSGRSHGAADGKFNINTQTIDSTLIPLPLLEDQHEIADILQTVDRKIDIHESKKRSLQDLFKTTLNKLMTVQIRVNDLDIDMSEVST
jgi:type I restriction enzyme, S subunit